MFKLRRVFRVGLIAAALALIFSLMMGASGLLPNDFGRFVLQTCAWSIASAVIFYVLDHHPRSRDS